MKAQDLRVGNIVKYKEKVLIVKTVENRRDGAGCFFEDDYFFRRCNELTPIELTPEILVKCGFEKRNYDTFSRAGEYFYCLLVRDESYLIVDLDYKTRFGSSRFNRDCVEGYCDANENPSVNNIEYLHQLQNLYFAITGNELEIKML